MGFEYRGVASNQMTPIAPISLCHRKQRRLIHTKAELHQTRRLPLCRPRCYATENNAAIQLHALKRNTELHQTMQAVPIALNRNCFKSGGSNCARENNAGNTHQNGTASKQYAPQRNCIQSCGSNCPTKNNAGYTHQNGTASTAPV